MQACGLDVSMLNSKPTVSAMSVAIQVRQYLREANHLAVTPQAIVNITEEALWNLMSACSNTGRLSLPCKSNMQC